MDPIFEFRKNRQIGVDSYVTILYAYLMPIVSHSADQAKLQDLHVSCYPLKANAS